MEIILNWARLKIFIFSIILSIGFNSFSQTTWVSHRGSWSDHVYPQNTFESVEAALNNGFEAVEIDIRTSKDGVPFLFHDKKISRLSSDCKGKLESMNSSDLDQCTISRNDMLIGAIVRKKVSQPVKLTRLEKVLNELLTRDNLKLLWLDYKPNEVSEPFIKLLSSLEPVLLDKIYFSSYVFENTKIIKEKIKGIKVSFEGPLGAEVMRTPEKYIEYFIEGKVDFFGISTGKALGHEPLLPWKLLNRKKRLFKKVKKYMPKFKEFQIPIVFWTLTNEKNFKKWCELGPDYILVDKITPPKIDC